MPSSSSHFVFLGMYILCEGDLQGILALTNVGVSGKVLLLMNSHRPSRPGYRTFKQKKRPNPHYSKLKCQSKAHTFKCVSFFECLFSKVLSKRRLHFVGIWLQDRHIPLKAFSPGLVNYFCHTCLSSAAFQNSCNLTRTMAKHDYCQIPCTLNVTLKDKNCFCPYVFANKYWLCICLLCSSISVYYSLNLQFFSTVMPANFFSEVLQTNLL